MFLCQMDASPPVTCCRPLLCTVLQAFYEQLLTECIHSHKGGNADFIKLGLLAPGEKGCFHFRRRAIKEPARHGLL